MGIFYSFRQRKRKPGQKQSISAPSGLKFGGKIVPLLQGHPSIFTCSASAGQQLMRIVVVVLVVVVVVVGTKLNYLRRLWCS